jgi:hypothetical protein
MYWLGYWQSYCNKQTNTVRQFGYYLRWRIGYAYRNKLQRRYFLEHWRNNDKRYCQSKHNH